MDTCIMDTSIIDSCIIDLCIIDSCIIDVEVERRCCSTLRGSHGLRARRARRTKSRGLKGLHLEVGARRAPRLLVLNIFTTDIKVSVVLDVGCQQFQTGATFNLCSPVLHVTRNVPELPFLNYHTYHTFGRPTHLSSFHSLSPYKCFLVIERNLRGTLRGTSNASVGCVFICIFMHLCLQASLALTLSEISWSVRHSLTHTI